MRLKKLLFLLYFSNFMIGVIWGSTLELAFNAHQDGKLEKAEELYQRALEEGDNQAIIYFNLGNLYFTQEKVGKAVLSYQKVIDIVPEFRDSYLNLGRIHYLYGNYIRALESFLAYYSQDPKDYENLLLVADSFNKLNLYVYAYDYYLKAIQLKPQESDAYLALADFFLGLVDPDSALRYIQKGEANVETYSTWLELYEGDLLRQMGEPNQAAIVYRELLSHPSSTNLSSGEQYNISMKMVDSLLDTGNTNYAIYELEKIVGKNPDQELGIYYLENIYLNLQKQDRGFDFFKKFFSSNRKEASVSIRNLLADAYNRNDTFLVKKIIGFYEDRNIDDDLYKVIKNDLLAREELNEPSN